MLRFKQYILTEARLSGAIGTEGKGLRHINNYIMPFLSSAAKERAVKQFDGKLRDTSPGDHGEEHNPSAEYTHFMHVKGSAEKVPVKVTGVSMGDDKKTLYAHTQDHGKVKLSSLEKPGHLKKGVAGARGFDVEDQISRNLGGSKGRGSRRGGADFEDPKGIIRGESKLVKGKMGESHQIHYNTSNGKWELHPKASELTKSFARASVEYTHSSGERRQMPLLQYLNTHHKDGVINNGFAAQAEKGTTRTYLGKLNANVLHVHDYTSGTGTSYAIGNHPEHTRMNIGHLHDDETDKLDGKIRISPSNNGKIYLVHRPSIPQMKSLASRSLQRDSGHIDLSNPEHASKVLK